MASQQQQLQSLVDLFNQHSESKGLPTKKCSDLKEDKHYIVHTLKKMDTSVGDAIMASLSDSPYCDGDVPKFQVFLPKRFVVQLQNENLDLILPGMLYVVSHGPSGNGSTSLTLNLCGSSSHCK